MPKISLTRTAIDALDDITERHLGITPTHKITSPETGPGNYNHAEVEVEVDDEVLHALTAEQLEWETNFSETILRLSNPEGKAVQ